MLPINWILKRNLIAARWQHLAHQHANATHAQQRALGPQIIRVAAQHAAITRSINARRTAVQS